MRKDKARTPCCEKIGLNKGAWTKSEDAKLLSFIEKHGHDNWRALPKLAGLARCGKSCRLRWVNYLRPGLKRGDISKEEEEEIIRLHEEFGNKWSQIAACLPGRTDNEIKNVWNTHLKKRLLQAPKEPKSSRKRPRKDHNVNDDQCCSLMSSSSCSNSTDHVELSVDDYDMQIERESLFACSNATSVNSCESFCMLDELELILATELDNNSMSGVEMDVHNLSSEIWSLLEDDDDDDNAGDCRRQVHDVEESLGADVITRGIDTITSKGWLAFLEEELELR